MFKNESEEEHEKRTRAIEKVAFYNESLWLLDDLRELKKEKQKNAI
jgi:hypothetical protein